MAEIANSHANLSQQIDKDIEQPLRSFTTTNPEFSGIPTMQTNLSSMARELEDAQDKSDKLNRKGGKASAAKVEIAAKKLETANGQVCRMVRTRISMLCYKPVLHGLGVFRGAVHELREEGALGHDLECGIRLCKVAHSERVC